MAEFDVTNDFLAFCSRTEAVVIIKSSKNPEKVVLTLPKQCDTSKKNSKEESDLEHLDSLIKISPSESYLAVCCGKKLIIWQTKDWSVINSQDVVRAASSFVFTPSEKNIILADKSGDVYSYELFINQKGTLLLGHLSVVLDVLVTSNEKYVITCDRDEKIRVSNFPNTYNIHSFCLGHKEFVSSIQFLPHDEVFIVSGSGDGTIKLWNYLEGVVIVSFDVTSLPTDLPSADKTFAVNQICAMKRTKESSLICFSIPQVPKIFVLLIESKNMLTISYHSCIDVKSEPVYSCFFDSHLWILCGDVELMLYKWCELENTFVSCKSILDNLMCNLSIDFHKVLSVSKKNDSIDYLYKKKYDNFNDYLVKKKARIEGTS